MRSRTPGALRQLSAFASALLAFLLLPGTPQIWFSPWRLSARFLVPGIPEKRHHFTAIYSLGLLALREWLCLR
jgi:hypothetical protein